MLEFLGHLWNLKLKGEMRNAAREIPSVSQEHNLLSHKFTKENASSQVFKCYQIAVALPSRKSIWA
jgi:hypothetical protein